MSPNNSTFLLKNKSLTGFLGARTFSVFADQMAAVVIGWQVYAMTKSTFALGMVGLVQFVPALLLTLFVGWAADRFNRKVIFTLSQALAGLCYTALAVGNLFGWINEKMLFAIVFFLGVKGALQGPSMQSILPNIVGKEDFTRAAALSSGFFQASVIASPALGGLLFALSPQVVYFSAFACTLAASAAMAFVNLPRIVSSREPVSVKTLLAGISFIRSRPVILGAISFDLFAVLFGGATALLPVYASDILKVGSLGLGLLRSAPAVGALLMSLWMSHRPIRHRVGPNMFAAVAVFGVATIVFAVSRSVALSMVSLCVLGASDVISVVIRQTLVQLETPDEMRGRVNAVSMVFINTSNQMGEFESGVTAALLGPVLATAVGGVGTLVVVALWAKLFPALAKADRFDQV